MRTTITLADDVAAAIEKLRRERLIGLSEAINDLVRAGLIEQDTTPTPFRQTSHDLGHGVDYYNVAETLETLEGPTAP
jgi:ribbon-helix-helix CopG family protein